MLCFSVALALMLLCSTLIYLVKVLTYFQHHENEFIKFFWLSAFQIFVFWFSIQFLHFVVTLKPSVFSSFILCVANEGNVCLSVRIKYSWIRFEVTDKGRE